MIRLTALKIFISLGVAVALFVIALFVAYAVSISGPLSSSPGDWGAFGSLVGGVAGSAVAAAALLAIIYGLIIQNREFSAMRAHLDDQKFFEKLQSIKRTYEQIVTLSAIQDDESSEVSTYSNGLSAFKVLNKRLVERIKSNADFMPLNYLSENQYRDIVYKSFKQIYREYETLLPHYFRIVYHLFKYLDSEYSGGRASADDEIQLAKAQLSTPELIFICLNACTTEGDKLRRLVNEWGLLEHLPPRARRIIGAGILRHFQADAFGTRPLDPSP